MPTITTTIGSSPTSVLALPVGSDDRFNLGGEKKESSTSFFETSGHEHEIEHEIETKRKKTMEAAPLDPRSCILGVGASAGKLCWVANQMVPERDDESGELSSSSPSQSMSQDELLTEALAELFASLWLTAKALRLDWVKSIRSKMALNAKKYPVEHCKGKAGKYTEYSHLTGITTENQSTIGYTGESDDTNQLTTVADVVDLSLAGFAAQHLSVLSEDIRVFAEARQWSLYHKPRNLVLALLGEAGELAEILQWEGDDWETTTTTAAGGDENDGDVPKPLLVDKLHSCEPEKLDDLSQELADVSIYAIRLATVCGVIGELNKSLVQQEPPQDLEAKQLFA